MEIKHGFLITKLDSTPDGYAQICADGLCSRSIPIGAECFVDVLSPTGDVYCSSCGPCARYERKKAIQRGEFPAPTNN